jgi:hypothetical protein
MSQYNFFDRMANRMAGLEGDSVNAWRAVAVAGISLATLAVVSTAAAFTGNIQGVRTCEPLADNPDVQQCEVHFQRSR